MIVPPQHSDLFRAQRVQEERRVRRHQQLGAFAGGPTLLGQIGQQAGVQEVLGLLDADERRRVGPLRNVLTQLRRQFFDGTPGRDMESPGEPGGYLFWFRLRRIGVIQQHQVGQHLQRTVRRESRHDRVVERGVLDLEQESSVRHRLGQDSLDPGHPSAQDVEDALQMLRVSLPQELDDVGQVVARLGQAFLRPGFGLAAHAVGRKVRHVPPG